jgi:hypothetical protein
VLLRRSILLASWIEPTVIRELTPWNTFRGAQRFLAQARLQRYLSGLAL